MRVITTAERHEMECEILDILVESVGSEYAKKILNHETAYDGSKTVMDEIVEDICVSSEWENAGYYSDDDIRMAIGRSICKRIGTDF